MAALQKMSVIVNHALHADVSLQRMNGKVHTLGGGNRQVAFVLAAAGCGGCSVRVGVLPLLKKALGLLDD